MNKMSKKTEYGLMSLKYLKELQGNASANVISAKDLAEKTHAPFEVIARVLQALSSRGILKAEYGSEGGYVLVKNLKDISIYELMTILESSTELTQCLTAETSCDLSQHCNIISPVTNLNLRIQKFYKSISVDEVLHV